ncbi:efflux RND transporter periplasmic adaptor subunit [Thermophagus sp. OGC60D27]|uniref:efflux RND transporter periplasmic adaptor subunit n=1 Tax=Thermophagus sp. OGC60D27 TaxID=3458415 RepID=UPI00403764D9
MNSFFKTMVVGSLVLWATGCGTSAKNEKNQSDIENIEIVKVTRLSKRKVARKIELSTTLEGYETVNIAPSFTGTIEHIFVDVGTQVNKGDMMVRMDQQQFNNAKLSFINAQKDYERIKVLNETGTVSKQEYDQAKLVYDQAKENLEFLETNTFVKAPFFGVIAAKNYEDGELYSGSPILVLTQTHLLKAYINIPESYIPYVREGMKLNVISDVYPDLSFPAEIEIVYPTVDPATHTFRVKIRIPNSDHKLRPGMYVKSSIQLHEVETMLVPYQAVLKLIGSNNRYVFVNNNGVAKRVDVKLGQRFNELIEVFSDDLNVGDQLVTVGQAKLVDGVKLKVVQ